MIEFDDEIVSIEEIDEIELMDIEVDCEDHLFFANGILTHNSAVEAGEYDHSHIAGGISKINTADNVFGIITNFGMKEKGLYKLQFLKTRSSSAVGQTIELGYDPVSMRITDAMINEDVDRPMSKEDLRKSMKSNVTSTSKSVSSKSSPPKDDDNEDVLANRLSRLRQKSGAAR